MKIKHIWIYIVIAAMMQLFLSPLGYAIQDPELEEAVQWMFENNLTRYDNVSQYDPEWILTREQWAKFFVSFNEIVNDGTWESTQNCNFEDLDKGDATLTFWVDMSCQVWLFNGARGFFFPTETMTKAQAITVLIRTLDGSMDETTNPRRKNYFQQAKWLWLTKENDVFALDKPVTRYEIALILFRAHKSLNIIEDPDQNEQQLQELIEILKELWLQTS